jgi:hypothetical protein
VPFSYNPSLSAFFSDHFNWNPYYLIISSDSGPVALLPLVNTSRAWASLPHFSYGGFLAREGAVLPDYETVLENIIAELSGLESGFYIYHLPSDMAKADIRPEKIFMRSMSAGFGAIASSKMSTVMPLSDNMDDMWVRLSSNLRRKINRSRQEDFVIRKGGLDLLDDFYSVYIENIRQLRSMSYSKAFFRDLIKSYEGGECIFFVAYSGKKTVGAAMLMSYMNFYENTYFASLQPGRKHYLGDLLHWNMVSHCLERESVAPSKNKAFYSFGRSTRDSGVYAYKNHWPVKNFPLYIYTNYPDIRNRDLLYSLWGMLPEVFTKPLGHRLIKHIY